MKALILACLVFFLALPATAANAQEVKFSVRVLLASNTGKGIDAKIPANISKHLNNSFGAKYSSFKLIGTHEVKVAVNKTGEVTLPDKSVLSLQFRDVQGKFIRLTMSIKDFRTTVRIRNGGLFFQAGHKYQDGILILAITASTDGKGSEDLTTPRPDTRKTPDDSTRPGRPIDSGAERFQ